MTHKDSRPDDAAHSARPGRSLRQRAEDLILGRVAPSPETPGAAASEETQQMLHELRVHQVELEMQNEELRRTQAELDAARARYFDLYDLAPVGYCTLSERGLILESNLTAATLLGVARGTLVNQPIIRYILPEDQDTYYLNFRRVFKDETPQAFELRMERADGTVFWAQWVATVAQDADGATVCRVALSDVTERRRVEEERGWTERLLLLVDTAGDFRGCMANLTAALQGWSECEAVGVRLRDGDDYPYYETSGFPPAFVQAENRLCADGPDGKVLRDGEGNPVLECMCGNVLCGRFDPAQPFFTAHGSFWSNGTTALLASTTEADRQVRTRNRCNGAGYESVALIPLRTGQQVFGLLQFNDHRPDRFTPGRIATFERMADNLAIALLRRQSEEALRASEERYRTLVEQASDGIAITDAEGWHLSVNQAFLDLLGYSGEELSRLRIRDVVAADELAQLPGHLAGVSAGTMPVNESRLVRKDGSQVPVEVSARMLPDGHRLSIVRDIRERKRAEEALRSREEQYRLINDASQDLICSFDLEDRFTSANRHLCLELGLAVERIIGRTPAELGFPEARFRDLTEMHRKLVAADRTLVFEGDRPMPDGRIRVFELVMNPLHDEDGRIVGIAETARDITERRSAEAALRVAHWRLENIIEGTHVGTWEWNVQTGEAVFNEMWAQIVGHTLDELGPVSIGTWETLVHPDDLARSGELLERHFAGELPRYDCECRMKHKDGHWVWVQDRGRVITRTDDGRPLMMFGTHTDITGRKRAEESRLEMERRLLHSQKLESLGVLAGGIAHDFNNLLMAILGNLELGLRELSPVSPVRSRLDAVGFAARRAADLTRQMLAYSGRGSLLTRRLDLNELVEENAHLLRTSIPRTVTLNLHLDRVLPGVEADAGQLQQVIMNLITNASEAIGGEAGVITLSTGVRDCDGSYLSRSRLDEIPAAGRYSYLEVTDNGCGMDEETQKKMFDPFFTTKFTGRGLGMAAVLGIVRGHGGAILLDSAAGKGTTIRVLFPVAEVVPDAAGPAESAPAGVAEAAAPGAGNGTILIVDDDAMVLQPCAAMVESMGFAVLTAADGEQAVEMVLRHGASIRAIILDLTMPKLDGAVAFERILRIEPGAKVILSSGYDEAEATERVPREQLAGFLRKPFGLEELQSTLERVLGIPL